MYPLFINPIPEYAGISNFFYFFVVKCVTILQYQPCADTAPMACVKILHLLARDKEDKRDRKKIRYRFEVTARIFQYSSQSHSSIVISTS